MPLIGEPTPRVQCWNCNSITDGAHGHPISKVMLANRDRERRSIHLFEQWLAREKDEQAGGLDFDQAQWSSLTTDTEEHLKNLRQKP